MELAPWNWPMAARSSPVGGPFLMDQLPMPPKQGLWAGQQGSPSRPGQDSTDGGEQEAIAWLPAGSANLSFQYSKLVAEGQDLGAELGVRPTVDDQGFQHQTDNGVGKRKEHDGRGSQRRLNTRRCPVTNRRGWVNGTPRWTARRPWWRLQTWMGRRVRGRGRDA